MLLSPNTGEENRKIVKEKASELAKKVNVEMPITEQIYKAINGQTDPRDAVNSLMTRERKGENA